MDGDLYKLRLLMGRSGVFNGVGIRGDCTGGRGGTVVSVVLAGGCTAGIGAVLGMGAAAGNGIIILFIRNFSVSLVESLSIFGFL